MLTPERHQLILQMIKEKPIVKIQELVDMTEASESTIRRDLTLLEEGKFLKRVHGGAARLRGKLQEPSMTEKSTKNLQGKRQIAQYAASLIEEGDSIYLDAGSTIMEMIAYLPAKDIVVVTNGLMHLPHLLERNIETYVIGGYAKPKTNAIIGRGALASLEQYRFDKSFLGVNGVHPHSGYTTPDQEEAMIKQKAMSLAREAFVLADDTKFSEIAFAKIADLHEAVIITNKIDEDIEGQYLSKTSIKVVTS
ncbi:DeoR/GlpR family DNA-binding transcription regulator [Mesobacillus subterraneus]|uniref:DeoR/GlpR family DNA-binding transcription regulator n=1 Tax=Mesobacillus subterraneus TaxID=285983 RepID=UPI00203DBFF3|nr:DeoR/GlpR family DNA-binding transcription regulator [Mesobacillus subterraneus]MCM3664299.1 DeoR/GlpR family DNA-binding transcription regulator [Mesobacillus subterraneus]MCM3682326.1 DeoR/GlpR family DNA-binding transcription regulator [Mesobacillus subterraneus]